MSWGFVRLRFLFKWVYVFVIQSEAKDLEYINVDVPEILPNFVPQNDKNALDDIYS